jgi:hypothetical protein
VQGWADGEKESFQLAVMEGWELGQAAKQAREALQWVAGHAWELGWVSEIWQTVVGLV